MEALIKEIWSKIRDEKIWIIILGFFVSYHFIKLENNQVATLLGNILFFASTALFLYIIIEKFVKGHYEEIIKTKEEAYKDNLAIYKQTTTDTNTVRRFEQELSMNKTANEVGTANPPTREIKVGNDEWVRSE